LCSAVLEHSWATKIWKFWKIFHGGAGKCWKILGFLSVEEWEPQITVGREKSKQQPNAKFVTKLSGFRG